MPTDTACRVTRRGTSAWIDEGSVDGEGGIRTLEAGISPPNALAGRRLQPLGHFSRARIVPHPPAQTPPGAERAKARAREPSTTERAGFEPATRLSAGTRFPVALLRPLGHLSGAATAYRRLPLHVLTDLFRASTSRRGRDSPTEGAVAALGQ